MNREFRHIDESPGQAVKETYQWRLFPGAPWNEAEFSPNAAKVFGDAVRIQGGQMRRKFKDGSSSFSS